MNNLEDEAWYREWHEALHRAVAAHFTLVRSAAPCELAHKEYNEALAAYHKLAPLIFSRLNDRKSGDEHSCELAMMGT
jgi:hypothetical protein